jgi:hypothetical protein
MGRGHAQAIVWPFAPRNGKKAGQDNLTLTK